jgi:hypothetical protein
VVVYHITPVTTPAWLTEAFSGRTVLRSQSVPRGACRETACFTRTTHTQRKPSVAGSVTRPVAQLPMPAPAIILGRAPVIGRHPFTDVRTQMYHVRPVAQLPRKARSARVEGVATDVGVFLECIPCTTPGNTVFGTVHGLIAGVAGGVGGIGAGLVRPPLTRHRRNPKQKQCQDRL